MSKHQQPIQSTGSQPFLKSENLVRHLSCDVILSKSLLVWQGKIHFKYRVRNKSEFGEGKGGRYCRSMKGQQEHLMCKRLHNEVTVAYLQEMFSHVISKVSKKSDFLLK